LLERYELTKKKFLLVLLFLFISFSPNIGWFGTRFALIIAHTGMNLGLVVLVMQNFIDEIPKELDEVKNSS